MIDKVKVLHGLSSCGTDHGIPNICEVTECPYREDKAWCVHGLAHDAWVLIAELLKAQEPVEPTIGGDADGPCGNWWYQCGKCKEAIDYHDKYCRNCGQAVKWG